MSNSGDATVTINDRYEIFKRVGRGGMADVFLARDQLLDRQVAIKVLFPEFAVDPNFVERFRREAQAAANLSHPNIVNVYDWGKYEGTYFIAMEYVQGRNLAEILKANKRLTPKQAAEIASEVAAALGFAHEAGLAHRDVKPANIMIGTNGQVKVADFGIARAMNSATESNLTQAGSVMGTASYFSPEQAQGAQPDPRSDLYSLGVVMYEMVAGKPPFTGENPVSIAYKQVHDQPTPLNRLVDGIPRAFEAIVAKLLAKNPKVRYASAHALRDDLRRFRNGEQVQALVAAAARPTGPNGATDRTAAMPVGTTPTVSQPTAPLQARAHPPIAGAPTTAIARQPGPDLTAYPPGASPDARYYQDHHSRTGWYALAAFIALIALVAGGVLVYQSLTKEDPGEGTKSITLDNYVDRPLAEVTGALKALGLTYEAIPEANALVTEEYVWKTDPEAGTIVVDGQVIKLYYNPTKALVSVPNVVGQPIADARQRLADSGFRYTEIQEQTLEFPEGIVIRTDPPADTNVPQETEVTIVVSAGPNQVSIPPIVIGNLQEDARSTLESDAYGLKVEIRTQVDAVIEAGYVIDTDPKPNTLVDRGSTVTLIVSSGPGQATVPPLVGLSEGQARNELDKLGFGVSVTYNTNLPPGDSRDGTVLEQSVNAGALIDKGTVITIVVGQAPIAQTTTTTTTTTTTVPPTTVPSTSAPPPSSP